MLSELWLKSWHQLAENPFPADLEIKLRNLRQIQQILFVAYCAMKLLPPKTCKMHFRICPFHVCATMCQQYVYVRRLFALKLGTTGSRVPAAKKQQPIKLNKSSTYTLVQSTFPITTPIKFTKVPLAQKHNQPQIFQENSETKCQKYLTFCNKSMIV